MILDLIDLTEWTAIAIQPHQPGFGPRWRAIDDAPLTMAEADALHASGHLLKACRVTDQGTVVVVKQAQIRTLPLRSVKQAA